MTLLVTDPLSAVSARLVRTGEQGSVEGMGSNQLLMNYLFLDGDVRPGDEVVTAGLGEIIPPGVALGTVEAVESESRQSFKRAVLKPSVGLNQLTEVLVLQKEILNEKAVSRAD